MGNKEINKREIKRDINKKENIPFSNNSQPSALAIISNEKKEVISYSESDLSNEKKNNEKKKKVHHIYQVKVKRKKKNHILHHHQIIQMKI